MTEPTQPRHVVGSLAVVLAILLSACASTGTQASPTGTQPSSDAQSQAPSSSSRQTPLAMPVRNFDETVSAIQPMIDSITWP